MNCQDFSKHVAEGHILAPLPSFWKEDKMRRHTLPTVSVSVVNAIKQSEKPTGTEGRDTLLITS